MITKSFDVESAPQTLADLLLLLQTDTEILLMKGDIPLARLSPIPHPTDKDLPRIPGLHAGTTWVSDDFDNALPDEFWLDE
jgi:antitoxin (DNA-binding transcriptional repressor) of toxin-antitoxin stability system